MDSDYARQLERIIAILPDTFPVPSYLVSIIVVVTGVALKASNFWMERYDAKRRRIVHERALCEEILVNHSTLIGEFVANVAFNRIVAPPMPFARIFKFTALEMAKANQDVFDEIPGIAAMQTLYEIYERMQGLQGGGEQAEGLLCDGLCTFETLFVERQINQSLILELCKTCAPRLKPRLDALVKGNIQPGRS